jgi:hypothetical protein
MSNEEAIESRLRSVERALERLSLNRCHSCGEWHERDHNRLLVQVDYKTMGHPWRYYCVTCAACMVSDDQFDENMTKGTNPARLVSWVWFNADEHVPRFACTVLDCARHGIGDNDKPMMDWPAPFGEAARKFLMRLP